MKTKITLFRFMPYEYKALEEYLEEQALKGWKLKSISGAFLTFEKIVPESI
ncbi:MAG: DUF2812 domain-containing protein, partial [Clostridium sp.]